MEQQPHRAWEWTKANKSTSPHIQIVDYTLYLVHKHSDSIIIWSQSQKEDFLPMIYY